MVPVRLQLRNFLSYGDDAPALDFGAFHVACLSGGNGQGKSALLDAVTWALWGEARKSSDSRKPDEQLLRVGAREMEVDFTFRLGEAEHRIVRRYTQTASGKTSKPGLEFQAADGAGGWLALTAESVRSTQDAIDARLGLDYETFVNSTFLLQGRSDEFTRKKPGERKLILAKILGLDRYDRLATAAGARWTALRDRAATLDAEATRLVAATESAGAWQADRDLLTADIEATEAALAGLDGALAQASTALSALDAAVREDATLADELRKTAARRDAARAEMVRLDAQIAEADRILGRAAEIEADHTRYEAVRARRTALDEKSILSNALSQQAAKLRLDAQKLTAETETRAERLAVELAGLRDRVREDERQVATRARAQAAFDGSVAAEVERVALEAVRRSREAAREGIEAVDKRLAAERGGLVGQKAELTGQAARLRTETAPVDGASERALERQVAEAARASEALDAVRERGTTLSAAVQTLDAALARLDAEAAVGHDKLARIGEATDETCPTCGTPLTADHRAHVADAYARDLDGLARQRLRAEADRARAVAER
ncbi:MAG TPA: SMC family ATPase, partial [Rubricoccaceae bacterium]